MFVNERQRSEKFKKKIFSNNKSGKIVLGSVTVSVVWKIPRQYPLTICFSSICENFQKTFAFFLITIKMIIFANLLEFLYYYSTAEVQNPSLYTEVLGSA